MTKVAACVFLALAAVNTMIEVIDPVPVAVEFTGHGPR